MTISEGLFEQVAACFLPAGRDHGGRGRGAGAKVAGYGSGMGDHMLLADPGGSGPRPMRARMRVVNRALRSSVFRQSI